MTKVIVCIKQVPDTDDIKWTQHNTIQREGLDSIINPYDLSAIQLAKNIKILDNNTKLYVVTMGPLQAKCTLKQAIAMGCDEAFLLSDKRFSGADTLATAYTLSQFIKTVIPDFDLIICGQQAIDGDTAQTPSSLAEKLGIEQLTNVVSLKTFNKESSVWIRETSKNKQEVKLPNPALIATVAKNSDILPDIQGYIKAQSKEINILNADDINANEKCIGLKGSPTKVKNAYSPKTQRNTELFEKVSISDCTDFIINQINKCKANND